MRIYLEYEDIVDFVFSDVFYAHSCTKDQKEKNQSTSVNRKHSIYKSIMVLSIKT